MSDVDDLVKKGRDKLIDSVLSKETRKQVEYQIESLENDLVNVKQTLIDTGEQVLPQGLVGEQTCL